MKTKNQQGFTLVEMIIVVTMTSVISIILFTTGYNYLKSAASLEARTNFFNERLNTADYLRQNVGMSTGIINQNTIPDPNTLAPDPNIASNNYWKLIHPIQETIGSNSAVTPILYFSEDAYNSAHEPITNGAQHYQNEYIVYQNGSNGEMRVRVLANPDAPGNATKTTCTVETAECPRDKLLMSGVTSVAMEYFSRSGEHIDFRSVCDYANESLWPCASGCQQVEPFTACIGPDYAQVEVVQLKIKVAKTIASDVSRKFYNSTVIRIALRNA